MTTLSRERRACVVLTALLMVGAVARPSWRVQLKSGHWIDTSAWLFQSPEVPDSQQAHLNWPSLLGYLCAAVFWGVLLWWFMGLGTSKKRPS